MSTVQFAGFSRLNGALKFRTANDVKRINQLRKLGDTDVVILQLPTDMSKIEAARYVLANLAASYPDFDTAEATALLEGLIRDENPFAKPKAVKKTVTVKKTQKIKISKRAAEADDVKLTAKQAARNREQWNLAHAHLSYDGE